MSGTKPKGITWWEKTVEYSFVRHFLPALADAVPFDGTAEELWGDMVQQLNGSFTLIEFKRKFKSIGSEIDKYAHLPGYVKGNNDYVALATQHCETLLRSTLPAKDAHWIVYGEPDANQKLQLKAVNYWQPTLQPETLSSPWQKQGANIKDFLAYTDVLRCLRRGLGDETAGRGGGLVYACNLGSFL